jgi:hypothetical protein
MIVMEKRMSKPVGSVMPDTRGRVSLIKFLPTAPGMFLVYLDSMTGVITLRPVDAQGEVAA